MWKLSFLSLSYVQFAPTLSTTHPYITKVLSWGSGAAGAAASVTNRFKEYQSSKTQSPESLAEQGFNPTHKPYVVHIQEGKPVKSD